GPAHHAAVAARVAGLPAADRIRTVPYVDELGARLGGVTLAVSRAGAMFCSELAAAGVPAVLVPFPAAAGDHQRHNAAALEAAGAARMLEEGAVAAGELWRAVLELLGEERRLASMASAMRARGRPDAAERIAREVLELAAATGSEPPRPRTRRGGEDGGGADG
ncbi:MAG: glycosyltransferase, partial [Gemmatimonadota bacterium]